MASRFLTGKSADTHDLLWASFDPDALCTTPAVADSRFTAYMAPHESEAAARAALIDAGCNPDSISEEIRLKRARRG